MSKKKIYDYPLGSHITYLSYYVKDTNNGIFIQTNLSNSSEHRAINYALAHDGKGSAVELQFEGDGIHKPLYKLVDNFGSGFVVGYKILPIEEYLFCDYSDLDDVKYIGKETTKTANCVKVAYQMNKTRWVPISSIYNDRGVI